MPTSHELLPHDLRVKKLAEALSAKFPGAADSTLSRIAEESFSTEWRAIASVAGLMPPNADEKQAVVDYLKQQEVA